MAPDWAGYWTFRDRFGEVIDERYHTLDWLDRQVLSGEFRFWRTANAAIITEMRDYPTGAKDIHGIIAAGDMGEIVHSLIPQAEEWGREQGCLAAIIESRAGWAKALAPFGYEAHQVAIRKGL